MTWDNIITLYKQGHQIGDHTMNHLQNMTSMPKTQLNYEIGHSKQCLAAHGICTTTFAYPFENGKDNSTIVKNVAQYYSYARSGNYPLMFLHCDHFIKYSHQTDCRTYLPNGKISASTKRRRAFWPTTISTTPLSSASVASSAVRDSCHTDASAPSSRTTSRRHSNNSISPN